MFDFLKFVVLLVLVLLSFLLCFVTVLFLKRQNVLIDWRLQYKDGKTRPKDEEREPCPEEQEDSCESNSDLIDCEKIDERFRKLRSSHTTQCEKPRPQCKPECKPQGKPSKDPLFSWSKGKISCSQGKLSCANSSKRKCPREKTPTKQRRPSRKKCVKFQPRKNNSSSTCECSGSGSEFDNRSSYWKQQSFDKKKVGCFLLLDDSQDDLKRNQTSLDNEEPQMVPAKVPTADEKKSEHGRRRSHGRDSGGRLKRDEDVLQAQLSVPKKCENNVEGPVNEKNVSQKQRGKNIEDDLSGVKIIPFSNHNLEKLREKRKERKRKLMKLQHDGGRLKNMKEWISSYSNSDAS